MIVTDDEMAEGGDISDHEYNSDESEEEKKVGENDIKEGCDDCDNEEEADVKKDEKQLQEEPKKTIDHLRRQKQVYQGDNQQVGGLTASIRL